MPASNRIRALGWVAALLLAALPCRSQTTLREQLQSRGIPENSFSETELNEVVDGVNASREPYVFVAYVRTKGEVLTGYPRLVRYDQTTGTILRSDLKLDERDECCGAPDGIEFVDEYILLSFHYNPSASSVVVLDRQLKMVELFYGFDILRVAPNQIVVTEDMMHFAPVHPERLQFIDLSSGASLEIYPLKNDVLRNQFVDDYSKRMPEVCNRTPELCGYGDFDEGCTYLGGNGQGGFAFQCGRSASYQAKKGEESMNYASDSAIYIFAHRPNGWVHCEQAVSEDEATALDKLQGRSYDKVKTRCIPDRPVVPDISTSEFSPFPSPSRRVN